LRAVCGALGGEEVVEACGAVAGSLIVDDPEAVFARCVRRGAGVKEAVDADCGRRV
jgi:hypothetical protein